MEPERGVGEGAFMMFLSAAIFGYFGWRISGTAANGQVVGFFVLLMWTLRISAILFAMCGLLSLVGSQLANLIYSVTGILSAVALAVVIVLDIRDTTYVAAIPPFLLGIFVAWNLYSSWTGLRAALATRPA